MLFYDPDNLDAIVETRQFIFTEWDPTAESDLDAIRSVFDANTDGKLTSADAAFNDFKLMVTNADGSTSVITLADAGIVEIDLNPDATLITLPDGSQITGQTTYTYADGRTGVVADTTLATDLLSYHVVQTSSTAGDGTLTTDTKGYMTGGDLAFSILAVSSADGSSVRNAYDDNGDGTVDRIQTIETVVDGAGVEVRTVINWTGSSEADGVLDTKEVTTTSADGNTITIERDSTGGGWFDEVETRVTAGDGTLTVTTVTQTENGTVIARSSDVVSADGKTRSRDVDLDGDLDTDTVVVHSISEDASDIRTDVTDIRNGDGSLRV